MVSIKERRRMERLAIRWPVCIWHSGLGRFVTASTKDVCRGGLSVSAPLSVPFSPGQTVEVRFPQDLPASTLKNVKPARARVAHVYKDESLMAGEQIVGLCFLEDLACC